MFKSWIIFLQDGSVSGSRSASVRVLMTRNNHFLKLYKSESRHVLRKWHQNRSEIGNVLKSDLKRVSEPLFAVFKHSVSVFTECEPRLKSSKNQFHISAGLNQRYLSRGSNSLNSASVYIFL